MASQPLHLEARVRDNATGPLQGIKRSLEEIARSPAGRELKKNFGELSTVIDQIGGNVGGVLSPAMRGLTGTTLGLGAAVVGVAGSLVLAGRALNEYSQGVLGLRFASRETGFAMETIRQFERLAPQLGIAPEAATQGLRTFSERLYGIKRQSAEVVEFFAKHQALGFYRNLREDILSNDPTKALERSMEALQRLKDPHDRATLATFLFGSPEFARMTIDQVRELTKALGEVKVPDAEAAAKYALQVGKLSGAIDNLKVSMANLTFGPMVAGIEALTAATERLDTVSGRVRWFFDIGQNGMPNWSMVPGLVTGLMKDQNDQSKKPGSPSATWGDVWKWFGDRVVPTPSPSPQRAPLGGYDMPTPRGMEQGVERGAEQGIKNAAPEIGKEVGKGFLDYLRLQSYTGGGGGGDGLVSTGGPRAIYVPSDSGPQRTSLSTGGYSTNAAATGLTRGVRNNNRGNLKYGPFAQSMGATGADDRGFAIFPDQETGDTAAQALLQKSYSGLSVNQMARKYTTTDQEAWAATVAKRAGVDPNEPLDLANDPAMAKRVFGGITHAEGTANINAGKVGGLASDGAGVPSEVLKQAEALLSRGATTGELQAFMSSQGYPKSGAWCGQFAASVVRASGGEPPKGAGIASNWRKYGTRVEPHDVQPGDVAVRNRSRYGGYAPTGATGSHVGIVKDVDPATGRFNLLGGNQGRPVINQGVGEYEFRRALKGQTGGAQSVTGNATIRVDVNAPRGTKVGADAEGLFSGVQINRGMQMPKGDESLSPDYGALGDY
jgi:hypothetical protein